jgi:hypothetical protein
VTQEERQAVLDHEHLRLLALFHYISGGITMGFSLMYGLWALFMFVVIPQQARGNIDDAFGQQFMPLMMFGMFGIFCAFGVAYGIVEIVCGRFISKRRARIFTIIASLPRLIFIPYGTILSIFTLLVLDRASVRLHYRAS